MKSDFNELIDSLSASENSGSDFKKTETGTLPKPLMAGELLDKVVEKIKISLLKGGSNRIEMDLNPPTLGKLRMHIIQKIDDVRASIMVESMAAKELIETNINYLKQSLADQGLKLSQISIGVNSDRAGNDTHKQGPFGGEGESGGHQVKKIEGAAGKEGEGGNNPERSEGESVVNLFA